MPEVFFWNRMGQVHAREPRRGYHEDAAAEDGDDDLGVDLGSIGVRVTKVHLKGLQRTKDDMVVASIEPVLKVKQVCGLRRVQRYMHCFTSGQV